MHTWVLLAVGVGNLTSVALTGTLRWQGWPVLVVTQATFAVYGATTGQQALWLLNFGMVIFASIMWRQWMKLRRRGQLKPRSFAEMLGIQPRPIVRHGSADEFPASWTDHG